MPKGLSPTQRTLRELRNLGRTCEICEKWIINPRHPAGGFRKDLFGFIDIISLDPVRGIVAIQSCGSSFAAHLRKITDSEITEFVIEWLESPSKPHLELWGWRRVKLRRGSKAVRWKPRIKEITLEDLK